MFNNPIAVGGAVILAFSFANVIFGPFGTSFVGHHPEAAFSKDWITVNKANTKYGVPKSTLRHHALAGWMGFQHGIHNPVMHKGAWYFLEDPHYKNWANRRNRSHDEVD